MSSHGFRIIWAALLMALAACGGGGNSDSSPPSDVHVSTSTVEKTADAGSSSFPTETFNITVSNPPADGGTVGVNTTKNGISTIDVQRRSPTQGSITITFKDPSVLGPGTYHDTINVVLCADSNCSSIQNNTKKTVSVTYTVTGTPPPKPSVSASRTTISTQALPFGAGPAEIVSLVFQNITAANVSVTPTFSTNGLSSVVASYQDEATYQVTFYFKQPSRLAPGTYDDITTFTVCGYQQCPTPMDGSPITINTHYVVSDTVSGSNGYTVRLINSVASDIASDLTNGKIYLSIPSTASSNQNTIIPLDPVSGTLGLPVSAGANPSILDVTSGGEYLYVGFRGTNVIKRFTLPDLTQNLSISLGNSSQGPLFAMDIQAAPNTPATIAVVRVDTNNNPNDLAIFDNSTARPSTATMIGPRISASDWGSNPATLYGIDGQTSSGAITTMSIDNSGVSILAAESTGSFSSGRIHHTGNVLYTDTGSAFTTMPLTLLGTYATASGEWIKASLAYPEARRYFALVNSVFNGWYIQSYDLDTFAPIAKISLQGVYFNNYYTPRLVRWGTDGLATYTGDDGNGGGKVILINGPFVKAN